MEFTFECGELARVLGCVKGVVPTRTTIPILNHALFDLGIGKLTVTAMDTEMQASASAVVETVTPGRITLPAHPLFMIAKALPKDKLATIKVEGDRAIFKCGRSRYDIRTLPADDYPIMTNDDAAVQFSMPVAVLARAIDLVKATFDPNHSQSFYKGLWVLREDRNLAFLAADGHQLSRVVCAGIDVNDVPSMLLPGTAVREISSLLAGAEGDVEIRASKTKLGLTAGGVEFCARLLSGDVPDYMKIVPRADAPLIEVRAGDLSDAVGRLAIVYSGIDANKRQPIALCEAKDGTLHIKGGAVDYGSEAISATINSACRFGISAQNLAEASGRWPADAVLGITTINNGPILITSPQMADFMQVIMPMAVTTFDRAAYSEAAE